MTLNADSRTTIEAILQAYPCDVETSVTRPWPIANPAAGNLTRAVYDEACRSARVSVSEFCTERQFRLLSDSDFVVAAFVALTGHVPTEWDWRAHVQALRTKEKTRARLFDQLNESDAGRARKVVLLRDGRLREFAEVTGIGARDLVGLVLRVVIRRIQRRVFGPLSDLKRRPTNSG